MATTRIIPLHAGKGRMAGKAISDIIDYVKNPEKTDHGRLITSYQCDSRVADARFYLGMTVAEIARIEDADRRRVWESIQRGLKKLARLLDTAR